MCISTGMASQKWFSSAKANMGLSPIIDFDDGSYSDIHYRWSGPTRERFACLTTPKTTAHLKVFRRSVVAYRVT